MAFKGYTQETLDFLWGIRFNNERSWFLAHKQDYEAHLLAPTRALGEQVYEALHAAFPKELPHLSGCPTAAREWTVQGPPVVLRPRRRRGLDGAAHVLL